MTVADTSMLFSLLNQNDPQHERVVSSVARERTPIVVPTGVMGELAYLIESRLGLRTLTAFLIDISSGLFALDCSPNDFPRVIELVERYRDLPLGYVDASVIACAERNGGRVLTLDYRHFGIVAREGTITIVPGPE